MKHLKKYLTLQNSYSLSSEEEESVFEFIRENQLLWNSKTKDFRNKAKKDRLWQEKTPELGYTSELILTFFHYLVKSLVLYSFMCDSGKTGFKYLEISSTWQYEMHMNST